jgi:hypothetical protein
MKAATLSPVEIKSHDVISSVGRDDATRPRRQGNFRRTFVFHSKFCVLRYSCLPCRGYIGFAPKLLAIQMKSKLNC